MRLIFLQKILPAAAAVLFAASAPGQLPGISTNKAPAPAAASSETPEQLRTRLQDWLKDTRAALNRIQEPTAESRLPDGISPAEFTDHRLILEQTVRQLNQGLLLIPASAEAKQATQASRAAEADWTGFTEPPPHSLLTVDDLLNQKDATSEKLSTSRSSITIFNRALDGIQRDSKAAEDAISAIATRADKEGESNAIRWQLDAARAKSRLQAVRAVVTRFNLDLLDQQAAAAEADLKLLDRKIAQAAPGAVLTDDDLAKVRQAAEDRGAALVTELSEVRRRLEAAIAERNTAKREFDRLTAADDAEPSPDLPLATSRLSAAENRADTLQFIVDNLENFRGLQTGLPAAYTARRDLLQASTFDEREAALTTLESFIQRLEAWKVVAGNELTSVNADLTRLDSGSDTVPQDDPRLPYISQQREDLWEKQAFVLRIHQNVSGHHRTISRWLQAYEESARSLPWHRRIVDSGASTWNVVKRIWGFEVTSTERVRAGAGGVPETIRQSITLGAILLAIVFFFTAYTISSRLSRRLQNVVVRRGNVAEAQANTLRNWLMIVAGFILFVTTLHLLKIPLTIFAFFGGALAIGLGFGTQTLIKNFISGIIVLFERKIRVGDIISVGNVTGSIVEINTRSSILRGGDGMETLIPNSVFLENQIANLTLSNRRSRRQMKIGIAYDSDPRAAADALKECFERHGLVLQDSPPQILFDDFADSALIFTVFYWIEFKPGTDAGVVASDLRFMIMKRFAELGIQMPYPQRDVHFAPADALNIRLLNPLAAETPLSGNDPADENPALPRPDPQP